MRKNICRQVMCLALAMMLVVGMLPGMTFVAHATTTITEVAVDGIAVPEIGETPDYTASVPDGAAYYIGADITWTNRDVNGILWVNNVSSQITQDTAFVEGGSYDVRMEIYAKDGSTFAAKGNLTVTINGQPAHIYDSSTEKMLYIRYTFDEPVKKQTITSIELYHETDVAAKNGTKDLVVTKINGETFDGKKYAGFQWYRSTSNFSDINESGVSAWDDSQDGCKFVGGYAYGLGVHTLPAIPGYVYAPTVVVSLKMPSYSKTATTDVYGDCYFYFDKLAYKPDIESVNITMDGYYVGANVINLTFSSSEPIKTDGGSGLNGRYTIRKYNSGTSQYDVLSSASFVAGQNYYLFFYLESDVDIEGLERENVKVNGKAAISKGKENGRTYYMFSLPTLTEEDIQKTKVSSIVISMPKAQPTAGDAVYYPTVVSVNGDTNLANAVNVKNSQWYQSDYHTKEAYYQPLVGDKFVQGTSYQFWLQMNCGQDYEFTDDCVVIVQSPSGNLEGELEYKWKTSIEYNYYYNLGVPTDLPGLASYTGTLSGYHAGNQVESTQLEIKVNGKKLPEIIPYGVAYAILDENQVFIEEGTLNYNTQYYVAMMVVPYNCTMSNITIDYLKSITTLNGMIPEDVIEIAGFYQALFKLPILKQGATCNGLEHDYENDMIPATFDTDGKIYKKCKGCNAEGDATAISKVSTVQLSQTTYTYDGQTKKPSVVVKDASGKALSEGKDYSLIYPDESKNAGTYTVKVILKGNYSGTKDLTFKINAASGSTPSTPSTGGGSTTPSTPSTGGGGSTTPSTPSTGGGSAAPSTPSQPSTGGGSTAPSQPSTGGGSTAPSNPSTGGGSTAPSNPSTGGGSAAPSTPSTPSTGGGSTTPSMPSQPAPDVHQHSYEQVITKATPTKDGSIEMKCACGDVQTTTVIAKASKVKLSVSSYLYNGKKKAAPKITVKDSNGKTISSKYYKISKPKGTLKAIGNYTYTITFKGDKYTGTQKLTLTIKPAKPTIQTPKAGKKAVTVKWKKVAKAQTTGYQVMVATDKKFTKNVKKTFVKGYSKTSYKMAKLKSKKTYYVKVRTYKTVKGVKVYSDWSKAKKTKTK